MLINSSLQDTYKSICLEVAEFGIDFPVLVDDSQLIGEGLELDRSGEVLVTDTSDWRDAYRGSMNDRMGYETPCNEVKEHYLTVAIASVVDGQPVAEPKRQVFGSIINFSEREQKVVHAGWVVESTGRC
jgi:hypothetical protein